MMLSQNAEPSADPFQSLRLQSLVEGQCRVAIDPQIGLTTLLGSCVAACLWDPRSGIGGMNHFLLPEAHNGGEDGLRFGAFAMEQLINAILRETKGARESLSAKLFGGGKILAALGDIGARNGDFARRFLKDEGIALVASDLGGTRARRVMFHPASGRAFVRLAPERDAARLQDVESRRMNQSAPRAIAPARDDAIELF